MKTWTRFPALGVSQPRRGASTKHYCTGVTKGAYTAATVPQALWAEGRFKCSNTQDNRK
jgi:hypothetical protein